MNTTELNKLFRRSASNALAEWYGSQWDRQKEALDDLVQVLWVWYLESAATQEKLDNPVSSAQKMVYKVALQKLARQTLDTDNFRGRNLYSVDAIKDALLGRSTNKYLSGILPAALEALDKRNPKQAEAIRCRYQDGDVPVGAAQGMLLSRAIRSLADEVNVSYITAPVKGVGSRNVVFPHTRKQKGVHSDPTGGTAIALIENPHVRDQYLERTRWLQIDEGAAAEPVFDLGNGVKYRATGTTARLLRNYPELIEPFVETKRKELFE